MTQQEILNLQHKIPGLSGKLDDGMFAKVIDLNGEKFTVYTFASVPNRVTPGMMSAVENSVDRRGGCAKATSGMITSFPCINSRHPDGGENVFLGVVVPDKPIPGHNRDQKARHIHVDPAAQSVQTTDLIKPQGSISKELHDDLVGSPSSPAKCECGAAFTNQTHQPYCPLHKR